VWFLCPDTKLERCYFTKVIEASTRALLSPKVYSACRAVPSSRHTKSGLVDLWCVVHVCVFLAPCMCVLNVCRMGTVTACQGAQVLVENVARAASVEAVKSAAVIEFSRDDVLYMFDDDSAGLGLFELRLLQDRASLEHVLR